MVVLVLLLLLLHSRTQGVAEVWRLRLLMVLHQRQPQHLHLWLQKELLVGGMLLLMMGQVGDQKVLP